MDLLLPATECEKVMFLLVSVYLFIGWFPFDRSCSNVITWDPLAPSMALVTQTCSNLGPFLALGRPLTLGPVGKRVVGLRLKDLLMF